MKALLMAVLALAPPGGTVDLDGPRWRELHEGASAPEVELPGPFVAERDVKVEREGEGLRVRGRWTIRALRPGWFMGDLLGPGAEVRKATWNGQPAAIDRAGDLTLVAGYVRGDVTLEVEAFIDHDPGEGPVTLSLLPAIRGRVDLPPAADDARYQVHDPGDPEAVIPRDGDRILSGAARLELRQAPRQSAETGTLVTATTAIGVTVGDAEARGRAHVTWALRRGSLDRVSVRAEGLGDDLEITGAGIREWRRSGDRIEIELQAPVSDRVDLTFAWSSALSKAAESSLTIPRIEPQGVFRGSQALQVARDGEIEVIPEVGEWTAVASADLPEWAHGLVEGTPTAAYTAAEPRGGRLSLLRFVPVEGPPVVVDVAGITIAASREGRVLMRAHYEVRNERAAHLRITPPPGMKILGARVAGETALPARGPDGAWLIPLKRSIETVKGALSFAVEVTLLGDGDAWKRRERRQLPLPRVSAPVAVTRLTLHLPPGYTSRLDPGDGDVVDGFTRGEGITYGMAIGEVGVAEADERFQSAVGRWLANDFEGAQAELDALRNMGASNENIERLQANLDVIGGKQGGGSSGGDAAAERRIREQAKARASADIQAQSDLKSKAEAYQQAGEYDKAEAEYEKAMEIGDRLALLEQEESVEQQRANEDLARQYKSVKETKARRASSFGRKAEPKKKRGKKDVYASAGEAEWDVDAAVELPAGGEGDASIGGFAKTPAADPTGNVIYRDKSADGVGTESGGGGGGGAGTVLYDFEDDDVEGELLRPDGADLSSRGRNRASGLTTMNGPGLGKVGALAGETGRETPEEPNAQTTPGSTDSGSVRVIGSNAPESAYTVDGANINSTATTTTARVSMEEAKRLPVGAGTSRDFTAAVIVDARPTSSNGSLFGPTEPPRMATGGIEPRWRLRQEAPEPQPQPQPVPEPVTEMPPPPEPEPQIRLAGISGGLEAEPATRRSRGGRIRRGGRGRERNSVAYGSVGGGGGGGMKKSASVRPKPSYGPPPPPAAPPPVQAVDQPTDATVTTKVSMDEAKNIPVGGSRRDFTAVVDLAPTASADAGAPPPDSDGDGIVDEIDIYEFPEDMNGFEDEDGTPEPLEEDGRGGLDRLAAPKVTASAMSVVIPAAGEAVLYQHLLLAAESAYAIEIAAREPLLQKRRRRRR